jgi:hypothetical protein
MLRLSAASTTANHPQPQATVVSSIPSGVPCACRAAFALAPVHGYSEIMPNAIFAIVYTRGTLAYLALTRARYCPVLSPLSRRGTPNTWTPKASESGLATSRESLSYLRSYDR